jgi:hypothetical protein
MFILLIIWNRHSVCSDRVNPEIVIFGHSMIVLDGHKLVAESVPSQDKSG